ncbi:Bile acid 7-dehydroxylase 2 [Candidatus Izimaplasma bacterium HR1]|jgi:NAD(P)-dependent dehydrogenase (short-subunit alcohol dehydrogenase family)|uniref:oxidoreductase n=1 Tax=Candidatus Izimoplasma sp. HR1 TaxID=1541959 RepID=UPI0004F60458|nr:Bile acid 7-dehydroxylase 2 [Candidatus Izimaplasma bacterium HR1]
MSWKLEDIKSLNDKTIIVTGGSSGLGFEAVKMFVSKDATVIMATRSQERALEAISRIKADYPNAQLEFIELNLGSKASIKNFADTYNSKYDKIDILLNNAGVMTTPYLFTEDGLELQQGINHFGHFYLTALLFKTIKNTTNSRVVNTSSIAHRFARMKFDNLLFEKPKSYNKTQSYSRSKMENLLFTYELDRLVKEKQLDVKVLVAHPGIAKTNLGRHIKSQKAFTSAINVFQKMFSHTAEQGALSLVRACLDETANGGDFYGPEHLGGSKGNPHLAKSNRKSHDKTLQKQLWDYSEKVMNIDFIV